MRMITELLCHETNFYSKELHSSLFAGINLKKLSIF